MQDASAFASEGELLSFLQLQARAASVRQVGRACKCCAPAGPAGPCYGAWCIAKQEPPPCSPVLRCAGLPQVLVGWYRIPESTHDPLELVVNPHGLEERSRVSLAACRRCCSACLLASSTACQLSGSTLVLPACLSLCAPIDRLCRRGWGALQAQSAAACSAAPAAASPPYLGGPSAISTCPHPPLLPQPLVWNAGDGRCKLISVAMRAPVHSEEEGSAGGAASGALQGDPQPVAAGEGSVKPAAALATAGALRGWQHSMRL